MYMLFDYLMDSDYQQHTYKAVAGQLAQLHPVRCTDTVSLRQKVAETGQLTEASTVTILAHGHEQGIAQGTLTSLTTWCELVEIISGLRGDYPLTLNLLATCNSQRILNAFQAMDYPIDEMWLTTSDVISINYALQAVRDGYRYFIDTVDEEYQGSYTRWTNPHRYDEVS